MRVARLGGDEFVCGAKFSKPTLSRSRAKRNALPGQLGNLFRRFLASIEGNRFIRPAG